MPSKKQAAPSRASRQASARPSSMRGYSAPGYRSDIRALTLIEERRKIDETDVEQRALIDALLALLGEDPSREGLVDTPKRFIKAFRELTVGYTQDPGQILTTTFTKQHDQMILVKDIPFFSLCEHHLLPFEGTATVAYVPDGKVVGLSKLARLVECFARRLQIQEQMTDDIADALERHLQPRGVGVLVKASHLCMQMRGVQKCAPMQTSALRGVMLDKPEARAEFLTLAN